LKSLVKLVGGMANTADSNFVRFPGLRWVNPPLDT
jgi:hypothetical protein